MNILFFLTPKSEVAHIYEDDTVRQALDKMEGFRYSTIPLLSKDGTYVGTITEGDLLWGIRKEYQMNFKEAENALYLEAGVKEYWIVDPMRKNTLVYRYEGDAAPVFYPFDQSIPVGIYPDLDITVDELLNN